MQRRNTVSWRTWYRGASRWEQEIGCSEDSVSGSAGIPAIAPNHTYTSKYKTAAISLSPRPSRWHLPTPCSREKNKQDRSEEHTSELQSPCNLVCRLLLEKKKKQT